jgi:hypothetical protein
VGRGKEKMGLEMAPRIGHMTSGSWLCGGGEWCRCNILIDCTIILQSLYNSCQMVIRISECSGYQYRY